MLRSFKKSIFHAQIIDHTGFIILLLSIDVVPKLEYHILLTEREFNEKFEDFILQSYLHDRLTNNFMAYEI